jgi:hypothetical protein
VVGGKSLPKLVWRALRDRCSRGERLASFVPHGHWKTITLTTGLRHHENLGTLRDRWQLDRFARSALAMQLAFGLAGWRAGRLAPCEGACTLGSYHYEACLATLVY